MTTDAVESSSTSEATILSIQEATTETEDRSTQGTGAPHKTTNEGQLDIASTVERADEDHFQGFAQNPDGDEEGDGEDEDEDEEEYGLLHEQAEEIEDGEDEVGGSPSPEGEGDEIQAASERSSSESDNSSDHGFINDEEEDDMELTDSDTVDDEVMTEVSDEEDGGASSDEGSMSEDSGEDDDDEDGDDDFNQED